MTIPPVSMMNSRVLVVEDEWIIENGMADALRGAGFEVLGPVGTVADALALIGVAAGAGGIGAAVLDVNLRGEPVAPVADALTALRVPFLYVTGYQQGQDAGVHDGAPWLVKPVPTRSLVEVLRTMRAVDPIATGDPCDTRQR